jgi:hypothetical protein
MFYTAPLHETRRYWQFRTFGATDMVDLFCQRKHKYFFAYSLLFLFNVCGKVIKCGRKIKDEGITAAIRREIPVNRHSNQFSIPCRTLRIA